MDPPGHHTSYRIYTCWFHQRFSPLKAINISRFGSDHADGRIELEANLGNSCRKKAHIFSFEDIGSRDPRCEDLAR